MRNGHEQVLREQKQYCLMVDRTSSKLLVQMPHCLVKPPLSTSFQICRVKLCTIVGSPGPIAKQLGRELEIGR